MTARSDRSWSRGRLALNKGELFASFDVDAFEVPARPRRDLAVHPAAAVARPARRLGAGHRQRPDHRQRAARRAGRDRAPRRRAAGPGRRSRRPGCGPGVFVVQLRDAGHRRRGTPRSPSRSNIVVTGPGEGAVAYGHLQIRVEELAEAVVVIDQRGSGTYADNVEFVVGDAARLTVVWIADWADDTVHVSAHHARLGKDAVLRHVAVTLGGEVVRMSANVRFAAPGGDAELLGLYFADDGQHLESRLLVDHAHPELQVERAVQGCAARGSGLVAARRAHRLGGRRADPRRGHRHRHLRGEPQPGAHRRRARRLGAQPGDRDRRDRRRRTRQCHRTIRRRATVLPALPRHPGRAGPPAGGARLLRRDHLQDRGARGPRAPDRSHRTRTGHHRIENQQPHDHSGNQRPARQRREPQRRRGGSRDPHPQRCRPDREIR